MQKTRIAAALLCCLSFIATTAGCNAQGAVAPGAQSQQAERGAEALQKLTTALSLTPDQVAQIKPILEATRAKAMQVRNDSNLTADQKKSEIKELRRTQAEQIKPILTPAQIATWKSIVEKRRASQQAGNGGQNE